MGKSQVGAGADLSNVVAVSGGVDSVVLLDMMAGRFDNLVVAHVDHGIREDSTEDYEFVEALAREYSLPFRGVKLGLGSGASEDLARRKRYEFLFKLAQELGGCVVTGHHADDVVETVAINLSRSTGWRGLAGLSDSRIVRPLVGIYKDELIDYARENGLEWREDSTNSDRSYLRNDIRHKLAAMPKMKKQEIVALWKAQQEVRSLIEVESKNFVTNERYWYTVVPDWVAMEVLYEMLGGYGISLTRPQMANFLIAIKVAKPGSKYSLVKGWRVLFKKTSFTVQAVN